MSLDSVFEGLLCEIHDADYAPTKTHREVLLILAQTFNEPGVVLLCEPSVVGGRSRPPDIAIIDPASGVHVVEVKGVTLDQVRSIQPGGAIEIQYDANRSRKDPSKQARQAMFDIKDSATRQFGGDMNIAFESWVAFPRIRRGDWEQKFGESFLNRADVLFQDDLESSGLLARLRQNGVGRLSAFGLSRCPEQQIHSVRRAFGDSAVLTRPPRPVDAPPPKGSRGEQLSEDEAEYRSLSDQQQKLASQRWDGPRLIRGVAGSGKTVVLATQLARMVERRLSDSGDLFGVENKNEILAVCFNRTLVPFIRDRIEVAYHQRTGETLPGGLVRVAHFNTVMWLLAQRGLVTYRHVVKDEDPGLKARQYLKDLKGKPTADLFYAVFVDEGQDFHEDEYRVLLEICSRTSSGPRMYVFYDDAQNLYGRTRPTWADLGLDVRGRSVVMDECFRSTRRIIEPPFNVLIGSYAPNPATVRTRGFADLATLLDKQLVEATGPHFRVQFAARSGDPITLRTYSSASDEATGLAEHVKSLINTQGLLPQEILIIAFTRDRAKELAAAVEAVLGAKHVRLATRDKDSPFLQPNQITVSTVASAKGYDAPQVIVASAQDFRGDIEGRASLYVGCTRAREWLDVSCFQTDGLVPELQAAINGVV